MKYKVAISMRVVQNSTYFELRDAISHDWMALFASHDICPILVPNAIGGLSDFFGSFGKIDGILLTGGNDTGIKNSDDASQDRDDTERCMVQYAIKNQIPVLGICRGLHFLNVYFGGRVEPMPGVIREEHVNTLHSIEWVGQKTPAPLKNSKKIEVNSFHNNAVITTGLAPELEPLAIAEDHIVESLCHSKLAIWAVQWHPERQGTVRSLDNWFFNRLLNREEQ